MLNLSLLTFLLISVVPTLTSARTMPTHETWGKSYNVENYTITTLAFYLHDIFDGENATVVQVAHANGTDQSRTAFGSVLILDDPLTETPDLNSKLIGRAQGILASASMQEISLLMAFTFEFMDGIYSGSSFSLLGNNPIGHATREMPVTGGTGLFQFARGFAIARTYKYIVDGPATTFVAGYNVTLAVPHVLKNIT